MKLQHIPTRRFDALRKYTWCNDVLANERCNGYVGDPATCPDCIAKVLHADYYVDENGDEIIPF